MYSKCGWTCKRHITGKTINEELTFMTDGKYEWRSDIAYYVEKYNLRLSKDFEDYVLKKRKN